MKYLILTLFLFTAMPVLSDQVTVGQKNKSFIINGNVTSEVTISSGDTVRFLNEDSFFHNVFSLSDLIMFDLGSFPQGEHRDVVFDSPGTAEVECAIHPEMMITIHVK